MELHPECSLCIHNAIQHWEDKSFPDSPFSHLEERDYSGEELTEKWIMPTASMLFRTFCSHQYDTLMKQARHILTFWDTPLAVTCSQLGLVHALQDTMSVYRRSSGSFTLRHSAIKHYRTGLSWMEFLRLFGESYRPYAIDQAVYNFIMGCSCSVKERNARLFMYSFYHGFLCHPIAFLRKMIQLFKEKYSH